MKRLVLAGFAVVATASAQTAAALPGAEYRILAGSTHAHTSYTWSHGEQFNKNNCAGILVYGPDKDNAGAFTWNQGYVKATQCPGIYVINSFQYPAPGVTLKKDWAEYQGPPSVHYKLARAAGYDFYVVTDHSQEAAFQPPNPANVQWMSMKKDADAASTDGFAAIPGFEFSENDGPGGTGHINVMNTRGMINALAPGVDLPSFYKWLAAAEPAGEGPVVASFNHPGREQYGNWADRDAKVTDILTMLEVINSNNKIHYDAFIAALDKGWKVAPVAGNDNHGTRAIARNVARTFVLAKAPTRPAVLEAMKNRRVYAALDRNLQCRYSVNGAIMGSTLGAGGGSSYRFDIAVSDPDSGNPQEAITKLDIVKDGGVVVQEHALATPSHTVRWQPVLEDAGAHYFFVRAWTVGGGEAPGADPSKPVAWLAPVWTGR